MGRACALFAWVALVTACVTACVTDPPMGCTGMIPNFSGVQCGSLACPPMHKCCLGDAGGKKTCVMFTQPCDLSSFIWGCDKPKDCGNAECCAAKGGTTMSCPVNVNLPAPRHTRCAPSCMANETRLCATNADCNGGACIPANFEGDTGKIVGICL